MAAILHQKRIYNTLSRCNTTQVISTRGSVNFPAHMIKSSTSPDNLTIPAVDMDIADRYIGIEDRTVAILMIFIKFYIGSRIRLSCPDHVVTCFSSPLPFALVVRG